MKILASGDLNVELLGRSFAKLDTGTHESLQEAVNFVETIEKRQGDNVACLEEIALYDGWLITDELQRMGNALNGQYLLSLVKDIQ